MIMHIYIDTKSFSSSNLLVLFIKNPTLSEYGAIFLMSIKERADYKEELIRLATLRANANKIYWQSEELAVFFSP
jgi:hypothetical protein